VSAGVGVVGGGLGDRSAGTRQIRGGEFSHLTGGLRA
jgi:hypothetical protein